jgi:hypothetical protein
VGAQKKARQWTEDDETDAKEIGKAAEKSNNKPKTTGKQKQNREKQIQTKKIAGRMPEHKLAENH